MADAEDAGGAMPRLVRAAWRAYARGERDAALLAAAAALAGEPRHGEAAFIAACIQERWGDLLTADRLFGAAARAPLQPRQRPWRVAWPRFQAHVADAAATLPTRLREVLEQEVAILLLDYPDGSLAEAADGEEGSELLGLFSGPARGDAWDPAIGSLSPCIRLFRRAHEHICADGSTFREEVRRTLVHELGHYVGFDEHELDELGMA